MMGPGWADLPEELLSLILSKLFGKDRQASSLVCRSWHSTAVGSLYHPRSPCLMYYKVTQRSWNFFQYNGSFHMDDYFSEQHKTAVIRCAKYGWVLMSRDDNSVFFFDPFHNRQIEVVARKSGHFYNTMQFFHPPTSPDCFIVGATDNGYDHSVMIGLLRQGDGEWQRHKYLKKKPVLISVSSPVLHHGLLYFLCKKGDIATYDVTQHGEVPSLKCHTRCLMRPRKLRNNIRQQFLFKIEGEDALFAAFVVYDEREVRVYRLLEPKMKWGLVGDEFMSDKVLYLSHSSSFGSTARVKSMGNKVYFAELYGESPIFYTLEDKRYHSLDGNYMNSDDYRRRLDFAAWIVPMTHDSSTSSHMEWTMQI